MFSLIERQITRLELHNGRLQPSPYGGYCQVSQVQQLLAQLPAQAAPQAHPSLAQGGAAVRYPTPDEASVLARLDAMRTDLQAISHDLADLPAVDGAAAQRHLRAAQRALVELANTVAAAAR